jgi:hypothetical protein
MPIHWRSGLSAHDGVTTLKVRDGVDIIGVLPSRVIA